MRKKLLPWAILVLLAAAIAYLATRKTEPEPTTDHHGPTAARAAAPPAPRDAAAPVEHTSCDHPFIPSAPGEWRRYSWRQSGEERSAELRIEATSAHDIENDEREITWEVRVTATDNPRPLIAQHMQTRCRPGVDAEEPWFGILEQSLSLRLMREPGRWRWPVDLRTGTHIEGAVLFDPTGADMQMPDGVRGPQVLRATRSHVVRAQESIDVPAGHFRAWRVDYEERQTFGPRGERGTGTLWIAPQVGLVKSRSENSHGVVQTMELVGSGQD